jgi:chromosome segregation ATPase
MDLQQLQEKKRRYEQLQTQAQTRVESIKEQLAAVTGKMEELGVDPETIDTKVAKLEEKQAAELAQAQEILNSIDV